MRDRTAMTEPLTIGQRIVAKWEGPASDWSEPADLAEAIDNAIAAEREAAMKWARDLIQCMIDNDPNDYAADAVTVLDVWRKDARDFIASTDSK